MYTKKKVYNFEVADWHTYFVQYINALVHNNEVCENNIKKVLSEFGVKFIADNPKLLKVWNENLKFLATASTKEAKSFQKYLKNLENGIPMTNKELGKIWKNVRSRFTRQAKKNKIDLPDGQIHHWNYNKADFPELLTNPKNLTEPLTREIHQMVHEATQSGKLWVSKIKTENIIKIFSSPL